MIRHRRRTPRPLVGLAAALALAGTLAACGSGGDGGGAAPGTTLTMWTFKQSHLSALQNAARTFQDKTGVAVDVEAVTPDTRS